MIAFTGYLMLLSAVLYIEVSDHLNMKIGENSMMGELQILLGVLTATIAQITNYWFGAGFMNRKEKITLDNNQDSKQNPITGTKISRTTTIR